MKQVKSWEYVMDFALEPGERQRILRVDGNQAFMQLGCHRRGS